MRVLAVVAALVLLAVAPAARATPFVLDGGRIYADVELVAPDGHVVQARAFVDLGGTAILLSPALYKTLGVGNGQPLQLRVGGSTIGAGHAGVLPDGDFLPFGVGAGPKVEVVLPATALQSYVVVIDYARRDLTVSAPGSVKPDGAATPFELNPTTGLLAVQATIDGQTYPVTVDAGSGYTWLTKRVASGWLQRYPGWLRGVGAVGRANMQRAGNGIEREGQLIRIARVDIGPVRLTDVGALAVGPDSKGWDLIDWYGKKNAAPVIGWLGGNVLSRFRLTIDYPNRRLYWRRQAPDRDDRLDEVGLTLGQRGGRLAVDAVATRDGRPLVDGVEAGDALVSIDDWPTADALASRVFDALGGRPGQTHRLTLERGGQTTTVTAPVVAF